jgi:hypothetical protein
MIDLYIVKMPEFVEQLLGASGRTIGVLFMIAAVFAFAFFVASLVRRQPQFQFLAEFLLAFAAFALIPVY